jgi:putative DNA primase/helicase
MTYTTQQPDQANAERVIELSKNIPDELKLLNQWCCYTLEPNTDGILTKIPRTPDTGSRARINDPRTFRSFAIASEWLLRRSHRYLGLEFMITADDPYFVIDIDHCIDLTDIDNPKYSDLSRELINRFYSYTEISRGGDGIHIIGRGKKPDNAKCRKNNVPIEVYDKSRPLVMTGQFADFGGRDITDCQLELDGLLLKYGLLTESNQSPGDSSSKPISVPTSITDQDLIERACKSNKIGYEFTQLWQGNTSLHNNDQSAADQALCNYLAFWTAKDADRIDRIFRQSGLYREKWERSDYRNSTIKRAIRDCRDVYTPVTRTQATTSNNHSKQQNTPTGDKTNQKSNPTGDFTISHQEFLPELPALTDLGNAEYFAHQHGENIRYITDNKLWLIWNGKQWRPDNTGEIERLARDSVRSQYDLLKQLSSDFDKQKALLSHIKRSESKPKLDAIMSMARFSDSIPIRTTELDANHFYFNCNNGTIDLTTGELLPHNKLDQLSKISPVNYNPKAKAPRWNQFLKEVFKGDQDLINFIQRIMGYCLTSDTREESVFILYGRGQCGKSKFIDIIRHILADYIKDTPMETFTERNDTNTADLAALVNSRVVTASEADDHKSFNESLLKKISGRDPVTCRYLYCNYFTYTPTYKVLIATNDVPSFRSQSFAMKRRIKIIPFKQRFYDPEDGKKPVKDDQVGFKLLAEAEGILAWMVQGCLMWQESGLHVAQVSKKEVADLFEAQDPLVDFLQKECYIGEGSQELSVETNVLWRSYNEYCTLQGIKPVFKDIRWFSRNLTQRDGIYSGRTNRTRLLTGIGLQIEYPNFISEEELEQQKYEENSKSDVSDVKNEISIKSPCKNPSCKDFIENSNITSLTSLNDFLNLNISDEDFLEVPEINEN